MGRGGFGVLALGISSMFGFSANAVERYTFDSITDLPPKYVEEIDNMKVLEEYDRLKEFEETSKLVELEREGYRDPPKDRLENTLPNGYKVQDLKYHLGDKDFKWDFPAQARVPALDQYLLDISDSFSRNIGDPIESGINSSIAIGDLRFRIKPARRRIGFYSE